MNAGSVEALAFKYAVAGDHGSHGGRQISAPVEVRIPVSLQDRNGYLTE